MKRLACLVALWSAALWSAALLIPAALPQGPSLVRAPYLQNVGRNRATILWATLEPGAGSVQFSTDRSFSRSVTAQPQPFPVSQTQMTFNYTQHRAELTGLAANTEYFYRVLHDGQNLTSAEELRFRTPPASGNFNFLTFGDSGMGTPEQALIAQRMLAETPAPALVLHTGDIAYFDGTFEQFHTRYFAYYFNLMKRVPFYAAPGNHEYVQPNAVPYTAVHAPPTVNVAADDRGRYFSFDWSNVHFIVLDSNDPLTRAAQGITRMLDWLEADLAAARPFWRVAIWHHPPYAGGPNEKDPLSELAERFIVPVLERYDVQLVLNGHEHSYQRTQPIRARTPVGANQGTVYITSGGGGALLYPVYPRQFVAKGESVHHYVRGEVRGARMILRAINANGVEFDSVTLAPDPIISAASAVNAASFAPSVAPGSLVSIFGRFLAPSDSFATTLPLPTTMSGSTVTVNDEPIPILYASHNQINVQFPFHAAGRVTLRVTSANGASQAQVNIAPVSPGIFFSADNRIPAVLHLDGQRVTPEYPAQPGEFLQVFMTGLGKVDGEVTAGTPAPPLRVLAPVSAAFGIFPAKVDYAGLAPGFAGLYQVNLQVPFSISDGSYLLRIEAGGVSSNSAFVPVRQ